MEILKKIYNKALMYCLSIYFVDFIFVPKRKREKLFIIHVIGDSHTSVFSGEDILQDTWPLQASNKVPLFKSYRIGATTAFNSISKISIINKILKFKSSCFKKEIDYIMLCFGEIDIRVHLIKQSEKQNRDIKYIVEKCIERYFITVQNLIDRGYKVIIYGPIASSAKDVVVENYSSYGTSIDRNHVTKMFTVSLEQKCKIIKIPFLSLFEDMIDEIGNTKSDLLLDDIHLSSKALPKILEKLKNIINIHYDD